MVDVTKASLNRRHFLTGSSIMIGALAAGVLSSCATSEPPPAPDGGNGASGDPAGEVSADNPFGVVDSGSAEIVVPVTGYGVEYIEYNGERLNEMFPNIELDISAIQDMQTTLQPRFVQGDVPDWVSPMSLDTAGLARQGQIMDLTEFYEAEAIGFDGKTIREILLPGVYESGLIDGVPRLVPYTYMTQGIWYSGKLFNENGWQEPETVDDFFALCEDIKSADIAPMAYQGQYPGYLVWHLIVMAGREGGHEVIEALHNFEEDAWLHPAVVGAARFFENMRAEGNFLDGTEGLDHTQSQTYWAQGDAAFIPCGGWLETEMGDLIPADSEMTVMSAPAISANGALSRGAIIAQPGGSSFIPEAAENKAVGLEFMRHMFSKETARHFTELNQSIVAIADYLDEDTSISPGFDTQIDLINAAGDDVIAWDMDLVNNRFSQEVDSRTGELARGAMSAEEFCEGLQDLADASGPEA